MAFDIIWNVDFGKFHNFGKIGKVIFLPTYRFCKMDLVFGKALLL